jgi:hypothetical protein
MIWTGALVGVAIVSAAISYYQWTELQKAGTQTDQTIAQLARQANALDAHLTELRQSNVTATAAMIGANRAWVDPAFMFLLRPLEGGEPISFQLRVENVGREPAIDAVFRFQISLVEYIPLIGSQPPAIPRNAACDALEPDATAGIVLYSTNIPGLKNWTVHTFDDTPESRQISLDAVSRRGSIVIDGCVAYRTFGQKHTVAFRFL